MDLGQPVAVTLHSCEINIDYFLSVDEFLFLESAVDIQSIRSVIEIGAGSGERDTRFLPSVLPGNLSNIALVDLPQVLELSRRALEKLIPQYYHKVQFVDATNQTDWRGLSADLAINIDSFQEMPPTTIDCSMKQLIANCRLFYVKNPIAKYDPKCIGLTVVDCVNYKMSCRWGIAGM